MAPLVNMLHAPFIVNSGARAIPLQKLNELFDGRDPKEMERAMRSVIQMSSDGQNAASLVIPIIKNASTSDNNKLKVLLHQFWPLVEMLDADGQMRPEMLLVCNSLLQDLQHPNEFIVASTLRCLSALPIEGVIENVVSALSPCLEHESSFVRAAAVSCLHALHHALPHLLPDAPRDVASLLRKESDSFALRAALGMLATEDPDLALSALGERREELLKSRDANVLLALVDTAVVLLPRKTGRIKLIRLVKQIADRENLPAAVDASLAAALQRMQGIPSALARAARCWVRLLAPANADPVRATAMRALAGIARDAPHLVPLRDVMVALNTEVACAETRASAITLLDATADGDPAMAQPIATQAVAATVEDARVLPRSLAILVRLRPSADNETLSTLERVVRDASPSASATAMRCLSQISARDGARRAVFNVFLRLFSASPRHANVCYILRHAAATADGDTDLSALLTAVFNVTPVPPDGIQALAIEAARSEETIDPANPLAALAARHAICSALLRLQTADTRALWRIRALYVLGALVLRAERGAPHAPLLRATIAQLAAGTVPEVNATDSNEEEPEVAAEMMSVPASHPVGFRLAPPRVAQSAPTPRLLRLIPLSGQSERVYAEAEVTVGARGATLDVHFQNRSDQTVEDLTLEVASADSTPSERQAAPVALGPYGEARVRVHVVLRGGPGGVLRGSIRYTTSARRCVANYTADITLDIGAFLRPANAGTLETFSARWAALPSSAELAVCVSATAPTAVARTLARELHLSCEVTEAVSEPALVFAAYGADLAFGGTALCAFSYEFRDGVAEGTLAVRASDAATAEGVLSAAARVLESSGAF